MPLFFAIDLKGYIKRWCHTLPGRMVSEHWRYIRVFPENVTPHGFVITFLHTEHGILITLCSFCLRTKETSQHHSCLLGPLL